MAGMPGMHEHPRHRLHGPSGAPQRRFTLTAAAPRGPAAVGPDRRRAHVQPHRAGARAAGPPGRPRRGDAAQRRRRGRRHDPLARRRPAERRGRRRRRDAECRPPGRELHVPLPRHQVGTFWYHAHQASPRSTPRPLRRARDRACDQAAPGADGAPTSPSPSTRSTARRSSNTTDGVEKHAVAPGTPVRLRLINTDSTPHRYDIGGTPFKVVAIDGTDLLGPTPLAGRTLVLAAGGRYDVGFTMPRSPSSSQSRRPSPGWR